MQIIFNPSPSTFDWIAEALSQLALLKYKTETT